MSSASPGGIGFSLSSFDFEFCELLPTNKHQNQTG
jgi:hypothetical protein